MKVLSIVGARPEFIQAWPVSHALRKRGIHEILVHTGQHYDYQMSQAFFDDMDLPTPNYNLEVGSGGHGRQTGEILARLEETLLTEKPDLVLVRGDTNSTLAGILASTKLHIPAAHIEAGERSYDRSMPEEINRLVADCLADIHFCASRRAVSQLAAEGLTGQVHFVGDVMLDAMQAFLPVARRRSQLMEKLRLKSSGYVLVTIHRAATTDRPERLRSILQALNSIHEPIIFPVHPRTRKAITALNYPLASHIRLIEPLGYLDMLTLEENARLIGTDSGGVQREAYFLRIPCLTFREETEWGETISAGWNRLVGIDPHTILSAWGEAKPLQNHPPIFGDGKAAEKIVDVLLAGKSIDFAVDKSPGLLHALRNSE